MKVPTLDLGCCTRCDGCLSVCPEVFRFNEATSMIEVVDLESYPQACVDEAIKDCPEDCITWEER